jgi:hypothetical protein
VWILPHIATEVNTQVRKIPQNEGGPVFGEPPMGFDGQIPATALSPRKWRLDLQGIEMIRFKPRSGGSH